MAVEVRLKAVEEKVDAIDAKLDRLLTLRDQGTGVFWLASAILGSGIIGGLMALFSYIFGRP